MIDHSFSSGQELLELCEAEQIPISEAAVLYELDRGEMDREAIMAEMRIDLEVMRESIPRSSSSIRMCRASSPRYPLS